MISPGSAGKLSLKLTNLASSSMKDINVKLDLTLSNIPRSPTGAESSLLYDALPFTPVGSSDEKRISSLAAGKSADFNFDILVYPGAVSKVYKLPIIVTYKDLLGNEVTRNEIIGIIVGAEPDIYVVIDKSDLIAGQKSGTISFKFVNRGVSDIKFLDVILKNTADYDVVSSGEEYIGNVNSDDFESASFSLYLSNNVNKDKNSAIHFPLEISYRDANNVAYIKDFNMTYKIFTAEEKGLAKSNRLLVIVLIVVVMLAALYFYRRWERKRHKAAE
jgi:hypothetical protein